MWTGGARNTPTQTDVRGHHGCRAFRIPVEGFWLWLMYIPAFIISAWAMCLGGWQVRLFALLFICVGAVVILLVTYLRRAYPEWFKGVEGVMHFDAPPKEDA